MLINLRNALMAGKRLPYDAEVEYLESTGTQWIDTGVIAKPPTVAELNFRWVGTPTGDAVLLGARNNSLSAPRFIMLMTNQTKIRQLGVGTAWATYGNYTMDTDYNSVSTFISGATTQRLNGSTIISSTAALADTGKNIYLYANNSTTIGDFAKARVYSCKIWQNGVLVRDYIPVRKGTVGYLYDRVSGRLFGNAGTGDFVLGPDVVPVEYIESHGKEYINTGIILNDTYGIDINFAPMETASGVSEHGIFGSSVSGSGIRHNVLQIHSSANGVGLWMPSNTRICNYAITIGEFQHWQINLNDSDNVVIDNVLKAHTHPTTPAECQYPVYLFGRNVANTLKSGSCSKMRLATWMVCDGSGNFIQKWLPVRVGTEGAMMDVLTRRIYRNAGTGAFTYGNDLPYPIPA